MGKILIVQDATPRGDGFVGREDHRAATAMPFIDDMEEHVGRVRPVGEVADFIDDEQVRVGVGR